ncbi:hypothetical protein M5D96_001404 [Drosophila gunungcola]|uniref:Uncharacterized protein n=1 Tax=Drosophila gunungcola TaxID=103775 RepID=A0A9P9YYW7_9MUSC|nr:hypothetical protein M5D96_001404 [Drosophila gunungcola]
MDGRHSLAANAAAAKMMPPVTEMKMPLSSREAEAIALRPMRSCRAMISRQAGRIAVALSENITNGEMPRP